MTVGISKNSPKIIDGRRHHSNRSVEEKKISVFDMSVTQ